MAAGRQAVNIQLENVAYGLIWHSSRQLMKRFANEEAAELPMVMPQICAYLVPSKTKVFVRTKSIHLANSELAKECPTACSPASSRIHVYKDPIHSCKFPPSSKFVKALSFFKKSVVFLMYARRFFTNGCNSLWIRPMVGWSTPYQTDRHNQSEF